ncbi:MAG: NUDIX hydrolase N-terminal domain-containing protein [Clostridium sp.]|nr:NUDIX hydrolase N-terminal domain-containing protein [Clostridium sp.]MBS5987402.1 NUDIX hydrolase N-terminal domain-containing protein [Clostridium sp.]
MAQAGLEYSKNKFDTEGF